MEALENHVTLVRGAEVGFVEADRDKIDKTAARSLYIFDSPDSNLGLCFAQFTMVDNTLLSSVQSE